MKTIELSSTYLWDILDALDHSRGSFGANELLLWNESVTTVNFYNRWSSPSRWYGHFWHMVIWWISRWPSSILKQQLIGNITDETTSWPDRSVVETVGLRRPDTWRSECVSLIYDEINMIQIPLEWLSIALGNLDRGVRTFHWMNGTFLDDIQQSTVNQSPWKSISTRWKSSWRALITVLIGIS